MHCFRPLLYTLPNPTYPDISVPPTQGQDTSVRNASSVGEKHGIGNPRLNIQGYINQGYIVTYVCSSCLRWAGFTVKGPAINKLQINKFIWSPAPKSWKIVKKAAPLVLSFNLSPPPPQTLVSCPARTATFLKAFPLTVCYYLKVHKIENFFGFDFEICTFS